MAATLALGKIICFRCRRSDCTGSCASSGGLVTRLRTETRLAIAWLSGACVAGGAFGAILALALGG